MDVDVGREILAFEALWESINASDGLTTVQRGNTVRATSVGGKENVC